MGNLRVEPKVKPFLNDVDFQSYLRTLREAQAVSNENHVYYDLEEEEKPNRVRKSFLHVAEKEEINVTIRRERGTHSLCFSFKDQVKSAPSRMSAEESRQRIMSALSTSGTALQKSEIIQSTGISPSTWNIRIKELMENGQVVRTGDRRDTKYSLAN